MDMTSGALLPKILLFSIPLMLSGVLQLLFNAADIVVAGQFSASGTLAIAAIGSTTSLINLLISLFVGMSAGVNVLTARYYAAGQEKDLRETVHTAIALSLVGGILLAAAGVFLCRRILLLMGSPDDVIDLSAAYLRIYFAGMPMTLLYNFGNAIHQAVGDTRKPLYFLTTAGIINVLLNLFFVIVLKMDVAGVALATILSQTVSAVLITRDLVMTDDVYHLDLKQVSLKPEKVRRILQFGIPAGLQGVVFSISNVLIQSSVNSFGSVVMAGNAASANLEGFVYISMTAIYQACLSFTSQNYGARRYDRLGRVLWTCMGTVAVVGLILGNLFYFMGPWLLRIYSSDAQTIAYALLRMRYICVPYFLGGLMDTACGGVRGMGHSMVPMVVSLVGCCLFRVVWIMTVFSHFRSLEALYISYPITWLITMTVHVMCYYAIKRKLVILRDTPTEAA